MGIMDKVKFWKKDDDFDFDKDLGPPPGGDLGPGDPPPSDKGVNIPSLETADSDPLGGLGKKDDLGLPKTEYTDPSMAKLDSPTPGPSHPFQEGPKEPPITAAPPQPQAPQFDAMADKNMEVISAKLDMLRVTMEAINAKLDNLSRVAQRNEEHTTDNFRKSW
jgi:hypothetical protein